MLDDTGIRAAYYCAAEVMRTRRRTGQPIPEWLHRHYNTLDHHIRMSRPRHHHDAGGEQSDTTLTAREVATMIGLSTRQVQRRATQLGGRLVAGRYQFTLDAILEHVEGQTSA